MDGKLVFVGVATEDAIALVPRYPGADERVVADEILFAGGGPAATAAVAAARLGVPSAVVASVGDDEEGTKIIRDLEAEGVDISAVIRVPGGRSARSLVVISNDLKTRAISNRPGPRLGLENRTAAQALMADASWVHVDQHGWAEVRTHLDGIKNPPRLSVDAGNPIAGFTVANTALYVPTQKALLERYASSTLSNDIRALLRRAVADGAGMAVATSGGGGSFAMTQDGELLQARVPATEIISTLGAGDVFHGALLAGLVHAERGNLPGGISQVIAYATIVASLSCRGIDGRSQIPSHDQTMLVLADMAKS